jgi:hypothetical protein
MSSSRLLCERLHALTCCWKSTSFYTGIAGAIAEILSAILLTLAIKRKKSKKLVRRATLLLEND